MLASTAGGWDAIVKGITNPENAEQAAYFLFVDAIGGRTGAIWKTATARSVDSHPNVDAATIHPATAAKAACPTATAQTTDLDRGDGGDDGEEVRHQVGSHTRGTATEMPTN